MTKRKALVCVTLVLASVASVVAHGDVAPPGLPLGNGDKVSGTLDAPPAVEAFEVFLPAEAVLKVSVKGVRSSAQAAPDATLAVLAPGDVDLAAGVLRPKGRTGAKARIGVPASGLHRIEVRADAAGDYVLIVKWKSRKRYALRGALPAQGAGDLELPFAVEPGATLTAKVAPTRGSPARPRLDAAIVDAAVTPIIPPDDTNARKHVVKKVPLAPGTQGAGHLRVVNASASAGDVSCRLVLHAPKASKRRVGITDRDLGGTGFATGALITRAGGVVAIPASDPSLLRGAMLTVPLDGLDRPTACFIGSAPPLEIDLEELEGAGPTVSFGPSGLAFRRPATLTVPFDPAMFPDGTGSLRVFVRDHRGRVSEVERGPGFVIGDSTVSFPTAHLSAYRVAGPSQPRSTMTAWIDGSRYDVSALRGGAGGGRDSFWHMWNRGNLSVNVEDVVPYAPIPGARLETNFNFQLDIAGRQIPPLPRRWDAPIVNLLITQFVMSADGQVLDTLGWDTGGQPFEMTVTFWDGTTLGGTFSGMARRYLGDVEIVPVSGEFQFLVPR